MRQIHNNGVILGVFEKVSEYLGIDSGHLRLFAALLGLCFVMYNVPWLALLLFSVAVVYVLAAMVISRTEARHPFKRTHRPD